MNWSHFQFVHALNECGDYRQSPFNRWCTWWSQDPRTDVLNAWRLYNCANRSSLGMLILGGAKIRKDEALVANFGVTSQASPTDPQEKALVAELERVRQIQRLAPGLADAPQVTGTGSILSDRTWTPLLNDAFILGGAHAGHEFHLAEDSADTYFTFRRTRAAFERRATSTADDWIGFFRTHPELLWDRTQDTPRVLARELIGLQAAGYTPQFLSQQLSFSRTDAGRYPTFRRYLNALASANCRQGHSAELLRNISRFLFNRDDAFVPQPLKRTPTPAGTVLPRR